MKKIITLSIVCLVSGQIFAQNATSSTTTKTKVAPTSSKAMTTEQKVQQEAAQQAASSTLSLKAAQDKNTSVAPATTKPVAADVKIQKVTPANSKVDATVEAKPAVATEIKADAKANEEAAKVTPKKED